MSLEKTRANSLNYRRSDLAGGVRVLTEKVPGFRSASVGVWIAAGSRDERPDLQGSAHFLEHLLFKGTDSRSALDIAKAFDSVGGEINAFSTKEYTCVYTRVLSEDLEMAAGTLADIVRNPALREEEVESERNVILEEIAMHDDDPEDLIHDQLAETVFAGHPLGREVMGTHETVSSITPATLRGFHEQLYVSGGTVVSAAGDIDHVWLCDKVAQLLPNGVPNERSDPEPGRTSRLRVTHRDTDQVHLMLGGLGLPRGHEDRYAWGVLDNLLGGGMSSRLFQEVREKRGLAYSIYSYRNTYSDTGLWAVYAGTLGDKTQEVLKIIEEEIDSLCSDGATEEEIERAKGHLKGNAVLNLEDPSQRMSHLGKSELLYGEVIDVDEILDRIAAVTPEEVASVARRLLSREKRVLCAMGPFREEDFSTWSGSR